MSKELNVDLLAQEILYPDTSGDTQTDEYLLTRVASKLNPDPYKLRQFALLLKIDDNTYSTIQQQAEVNSQGLPLTVSHLLFMSLFGSLPHHNKMLTLKM